MTNPDEHLRLIKEAERKAVADVDTRHDPSWAGASQEALRVYSQFCLDAGFESLHDRIWNGLLSPYLSRNASRESPVSVQMMVRFSPPDAGAMPLNLVRQPPTATTPGWAVQVVPIPKEPA